MFRSILNENSENTHSYNIRFKKMLIKVKKMRPKVVSFLRLCKSFFISFKSNSIIYLKRIYKKFLYLLGVTVSFVRKLDKDTASEIYTKAKIFLMSAFNKLKRVLKILKQFKKEDWVNLFNKTINYSKLYVHQNKKKITKTAHIVAPLMAVVVLLSTICYWNNVNYGLVLAYDGEEVVAIQDEEVFEKANQMVNERLISSETNNDKDVPITTPTPTYKLAIVKNEELASPDVVCDKIIEKSKGAIEEATGLYINRKLIAAVKQKSDILEILDEILASESKENIEIEFCEEIETTEGLFPTNNIVSKEELRDILNEPFLSEESYVVKLGDTPIGIANSFNMSLSELRNLNSDIELEDLMYENKQIKVLVSKKVLTLKKIIEECYESKIPYQVIKIQDNEEYTDYVKVTKKGEEGNEKRLDKVTYINGIETYRESISVEVIKEPINKEITVGTKKRTKNNSKVQGTGKSSGTLMWPVPYTKNVTSGYGKRWGTFHSGIDIAANGIKGQPIVAADGGTVSFVKQGNSGYGNHLKIDHGNGMYTLYAHCSSINVSAGQKVSKGQAIATVGSTGNSTGPHLHFEVIVNNKKQNPKDYV